MRIKKEYTTDIKALKGVLETLPIHDIAINDHLQVRKKLKDTVIQQYRSTYLTNTSAMPPVKVVRTEEGALLLVDGWHRMAALKDLGWPYVDAEVIEGTFQDAVVAASQANLTHGLSLTKEEKLQAFKVYMREKQYQKPGRDGKRMKGTYKTLREIAIDLHGVVQHTTIRNWIKRYSHDVYVAGYSIEDAGGEKGS